MTPQPVTSTWSLSSWRKRNSVVLTEDHQFRLLCGMSAWRMDGSSADRWSGDGHERRCTRQRQSLPAHDRDRPQTPRKSMDATESTPRENLGAELLSRKDRQRLERNGKDTGSYVLEQSRTGQEVRGFDKSSSSSSRSTSSSSRYGKGESGFCENTGTESVAVSGDAQRMAGEGEEEEGGADEHGTVPVWEERDSNGDAERQAVPLRPAGRFQNPGLRDTNANALYRMTTPDNSHHDHGDQWGDTAVTHTLIVTHGSHTYTFRTGHDPGSRPRREPRVMGVQSERSTCADSVAGAQPRSSVRKTWRDGSSTGLSHRPVRGRLQARGHAGRSQQEQTLTRHFFITDRRTSSVEAECQQPVSVSKDSEVQAVAQASGQDASVHRLTSVAAGDGSQSRGAAAQREPSAGLPAYRVTMIWKKSRTRLKHFPQKEEEAERYRVPQTQEVTTESAVKENSTTSTSSLTRRVSHAASAVCQGSFCDSLAPTPVSATASFQPSCSSREVAAPPTADTPSPFPHHQTPTGGVNTAGFPPPITDEAFSPDNRQDDGEIHKRHLSKLPGDERESGTPVKIAAAPAAASCKDNAFRVLNSLVVDTDSMRHKQPVTRGQKDLRVSCPRDIVTGSVRDRQSHRHGIKHGRTRMDRNRNSTSTGCSGTELRHQAGSAFLIHPTLLLKMKNKWNAKGKLETLKSVETSTTPPLCLQPQAIAMQTCFADSHTSDQVCLALESSESIQQTSERKTSAPTSPSSPGLEPPSVSMTARNDAVDLHTAHTKAGLTLDKMPYPSNNSLSNHMDEVQSDKHLHDIKKHTYLPGKNGKMKMFDKHSSDSMDTNGVERQLPKVQCISVPTEIEKPLSEWVEEDLAHTEVMPLSSRGRVVKADDGKGHLPHHHHHNQSCCRKNCQADASLRQGMQDKTEALPESAADVDFSTGHAQSGLTRGKSHDPNVFKTQDANAVTSPVYKVAPLLSRAEVPMTSACCSDANPSTREPCHDSSCVCRRYKSKSSTVSSADEWNQSVSTAAALEEGYRHYQNETVKEQDHFDIAKSASQSKSLHSSETRTPFNMVPLLAKQLHLQDKQCLTNSVYKTQPECSLKERFPARLCDESFASKVSFMSRTTENKSKLLQGLDQYRSRRSHKVRKRDPSTDEHSGYSVEENILKTTHILKGSSGKQFTRIIEKKTKPGKIKSDNGVSSQLQAKKCPRNTFVKKNTSRTQTSQKAQKVTSARSQTNITIQAPPNSPEVTKYCGWQVNSGRPQEREAQKSARSCQTFRLATVGVMFDASTYGEQEYLRASTPGFRPWRMSRAVFEAPPTSPTSMQRKQNVHIWLRSCLSRHDSMSMDPDFAAGHEKCPESASEPLSITSSADYAQNQTVLPGSKPGPWCSVHSGVPNSPRAMTSEAGSTFAENGIARDSRNDGFHPSQSLRRIGSTNMGTKKTAQETVNASCACKGQATWQLARDMSRPLPMPPRLERGVENSPIQASAESGQLDEGSEANCWWDRVSQDHSRDGDKSLKKPGYDCIQSETVSHQPGQSVSSVPRKSIFKHTACHNFNDNNIRQHNNQTAWEESSQTSECPSVSSNDTPCCTEDYSGSSLKQDTVYGGQNWCLRDMKTKGRHFSYLDNSNACRHSETEVGDRITGSYFKIRDPDLSHKGAQRGRTEAADFDSGSDSGELQSGRVESDPEASHSSATDSDSLLGLSDRSKTSAGHCTRGDSALPGRGGDIAPFSGESQAWRNHGHQPEDKNNINRHNRSASQGKRKLGTPNTLALPDMKERGADVSTQQNISDRQTSSAAGAREILTKDEREQGKGLPSLPTGDEGHCAVLSMNAGLALHAQTKEEGKFGPSAQELAAECTTSGNHRKHCRRKQELAERQNRGKRALTPKQIQMVKPEDVAKDTGERQRQNNCCHAHHYRHKQYPGARYRTNQNQDRERYQKPDHDKRKLRLHFVTAAESGEEQHPSWTRYLAHYDEKHGRLHKLSRKYWPLSAVDRSEKTDLIANHDLDTQHHRHLGRRNDLVPESDQPKTSGICDSKGPDHSREGSQRLSPLPGQALTSGTDRRFRGQAAETNSPEEQSSAHLQLNLSLLCTRLGGTWRNPLPL